MDSRSILRVDIGFYVSKSIYEILSIGLTRNIDSSSHGFSGILQSTTLPRIAASFCEAKSHDDSSV